MDKAMEAVDKIITALEKLGSKLALSAESVTPLILQAMWWEAFATLLVTWIALGAGIWGLLRSIEAVELADRNRDCVDKRTTTAALCALGVIISGIAAVVTFQASVRTLADPLGSLILQLIPK